MSVETTLRERLETAAERVVPPIGPGASAIRERARRRTRRSRITRATALAVVVALIGVVLADHVADERSGLTTDVDAPDYRRPTPDQLDGELPPDEVDPPEWRAVDASVFGDETAYVEITWTGERFAAAAFQYDGDAPAARLALSVDGETWELVDAPDVASIGSVAEFAGSLWVVGRLDDDPAPHLYRLPGGAADWEEVPIPASDAEGFARADGLDLRIVAPSSSSGPAWLIETAYTDPITRALLDGGYATEDQLGNLVVAVGEDGAIVDLFDENGEGIDSFELTRAEIEAFDGPSEQFRVLRLDPATGQADVEGSGEGFVFSAVADGQDVLVAGYDGGWGWWSDDAGPTPAIWRVDADGIAIVRAVDDLGGEAAIAAGLGELWVLAWDSATGARTIAPLGETADALPYADTIAGGSDALVATGFVYDANLSLVESAVQSFNAALGRADNAEGAMIALTTDGDRWSWQDAEEVFGADSRVDWISAAVGNGRIIATGTNYSGDDAPVQVLAVAEVPAG